MSKGVCEKALIHLSKTLKPKYYCKQNKPFKLGCGAKNPKHLMVHEDTTFPGRMLVLACLPHPEALSTLTCSLVMASWPPGFSPSSQRSPSVTSIIAVARKMALS